MFIEHQDSLKKEISNNFFLQTLKVNDINYFVNDDQKKYIDNKIDKNNCVEDAIQNIFPSMSVEDFKTEYLNDQRIYEIVWTKKENQEYLSKKISDIFSEKLSTKCRRFPNNYNQKQIAKIFEKGKAKNIL